MISIVPLFCGAFPGRQPLRKMKEGRKEIHKLSTWGRCSEEFDPHRVDALNYFAILCESTGVPPIDYG